jgi:hypothetical protein
MVISRSDRIEKQYYTFFARNKKYAITMTFANDLQYLSEMP